MKKRSIFWGIVLICTAVLILLNSILGSLDLPRISGIPIVRLLLGVLCIAWIIDLLFHNDWRVIFYPLAFLFMLFQKDIAQWIHAPGEKLISNWIVLLCAVLLHIGASILFPKRRSKDLKNRQKNNQFASFSQYIDCADFTNRKVEVNMGKCDVYFENIDLYPGDATLEIDLNMGKVLLHVPADWAVVPEVHNNMGSLHISPSTGGEGKRLTVTGENNMGEIRILRN